MSNAKETPPEITNELLDALPIHQFNNIQPLLTLVDLEIDDILWEMDEIREYVYFPTTAMVCLLYDTEEGTSIEVGMTGRQGMVGVVTFIGDARMAKRAVVQNAGQAYRMKAEDAKDYFEEIPDFREICMCYTQTLIAQISQSAICNRLHSVEQQIARYLLVSCDNLRVTSFKMTHARIADVLGVRRESVSLAARQLQNRGFIKYGDGNLDLLDREGLLTAACECYEVVKEQYKRIINEYLSLHDA